MAKKMYKISILLICLLANRSSLQPLTRQATVLPISSEKFTLPDSPYWDAESQRLYFVDAGSKNFSVACYDYKSGKIYRAAVIGTTGATFIIPLTRGKNLFLLGFTHAAKVIKWDGCSPYAQVVRTAFKVETGPETASNHWHFGVADPQHRFYGSTYRAAVCSNSTAAAGGFYRYGKREGLQKIFSDVKVAGGIAFNRKRKKVYFVDTCRLSISEYSFNKKGVLYNGKTLFDFRTAEDPYPSELPAGITVDRAGNLFVTAYNGSAVYILNPINATQLNEIPIPAQLVTGIAFGGPNLTTLFVTTAKSGVQSYDGSPYEDTESPLAGTIFRVDGLDYKGFGGRRVCV